MSNGGSSAWTNGSCVNANRLFFYKNIFINNFAYSGMAALVAFPACTNHKLLLLPVNDGKQALLSLKSEDLLILRAKFRLHPIFIFDEVSMISNVQFAHIHARLASVNCGQYDPNISFGE